MLVGYENTHYFHQFTNKRRVTNAVWEEVDEDNTKVFDQASIRKESRSYFADLYKEPDTVTIEDQLEVLNLFPSYVSNEDNRSIFIPVTIKEVETTLKNFAKDKSPGPDGWTVEFFLHFFDMLGLELVEAIEYTWL